MYPGHIRGSMTKKILLFQCFFVLLCGILMAKDTEAKVISLKGNPKAIEKQSIRVLKLGDVVKVGERLLTGKEEHLTLKLSSGHKIFVLASTTATLSKLMDGKVELDQKTGSIWSQIRPLGKEESFQIRTPASVAGVRGTSFISMVMDPENTSICVCEGKVEVTSGGEKKVLEKGFGAVLTKGVKPPEPMSNVGKIHNRRRMARKKACFSCHWAGEGDVSRLDEESNLIFQAKPQK